MGDANQSPWADGARNIDAHKAAEEAKVEAQIDEIDKLIDDFLARAAVIAEMPDERRGAIHAIGMIAMRYGETRHGGEAQHISVPHTLDVLKEAAAGVIMATADRSEWVNNATVFCGNLAIAIRKELGK